MNKGVIAGLVAAALVGGGAYYVTQGKLGGASGAQSLDYVPADTLVFAGGLEPMSWGDLAAFRDGFSVGSNPAEMQTFVNDLVKSETESGEKAPDGVRLMLSLYADYLAAVMDKNFKPETLGLSDKIDSALYTVGALPVIRIKLADEAAFDAFLAKAESRFQLKAAEGKLDSFSYKRYSLIDDAKQPVYLAIGKRDGFVVFTLDAGDLIPANEGLSIAFGLTKPAQPLKASGVLDAMVKEYGFKPFSLGYLNHEALIRILTRADNPVAKLLDKVSNGESATEFAPLRTAACQSEIEGMAALWPKTVFGYTKLESSGSPIQISSLLKVVSTDAAAMEQLQKLRGFLPDLSAGHSKFSYQMGLNMDELTPVLTNLWSRATQAKFTCEPLVAAQAELKQVNPSMLGAMTGMVQGVQGFGFDLQALSLKPAAEGTEMPEIADLSFMATISSKQPQQLWSMLAMMQPELAAMQLPADGQSVELPLPLPVELPGKIKLGLFGKHIVLFSGDKAEALTGDLAKQELKPNGLFHLGLDYGLLADAVDLLLQDKLAKLTALTAEAEAEAQDGANESAATDDAYADFMPLSAADRKERAAAEVEELKAGQTMLNALRGVRLSSGMDFTATGVDVSADMELPTK
ncbi:MAG: hypothetical protein KAY67_04670 [Aeromonadaceae bacterium]|nr:hypothetical protein [Aeromonadaceae bacterium]